MSKLPKVLIACKAPADHFAPLDGIAEVIDGCGDDELMSRECVIEEARDFEGIINHGILPVDKELLDAAPQLKVIANVSIGTDNFDLPLMTARGVWGTNAPDAFTDATADCTMALLLAAARNVPQSDAYVRRGEWESGGNTPGTFLGFELRDKTLGIVGYGSIGEAVANRAKAFGMKVIYYNRSGHGQPDWRPLETLLAEADVVSIHTPLTSETRGMINADCFARMKPQTWVINMARGPVVDEPSLLDALDSGRIAGAALDVFPDEPRVNPRLMAMHNVVLTPHIGGATLESRRRARQVAAQNVANILQGKKPVSPMNEVG